MVLIRSKTRSQGGVGGNERQEEDLMCIEEGLGVGVQGILRHVDFTIVRCLIIASPGFTKVRRNGH